jgi:Kef-type K+ transport system membrane component KefB
MLTWAQAPGPEGREDILIDLAVIFIAAKLAGALFERLKQPPVIGELLAGVLIGPHLLGWIGHSETHVILQEVGAIVLLFAVGLDTPLSDLRAVGGRSLAVGIAGIVLPFLAGWLLIDATEGSNTNEALFMGAAMVATSVGVTARVLADLGRVRDKESRVILGAAVVDDILGLLVLALVVGVASDGIGTGSLLLLAVEAVGFVALVGGVGPALVKRATPLLDRFGELGVFSIALGLCLALSAAAGAIELAAIIGAFLAGMAFAETRDRYKLEEHLASVYTLLVPFFFVVTGSLVDLDVLTEGDTAALGLAVLAVAIAGKLIGCGAAAWGMGRRSTAIVAVGMVPRGEVGIIVATIGLAEGIVEPDLYGIVVLMSVLTTLLVPPVLSALYRGAEKGPPKRPDVHTAEIEGIGG